MAGAGAESFSRTHWELYGGRYWGVALYMLQVYEWLLTLDDEHELVHQSRRWNVTKVAFLFCRYWPLATWPLFLRFWFVNVSFETCSKAIRPLYALLIFFHLPPQVVFLLRAYGFTGRKTLILVILGLSFTALLVVCVWALAMDVHPLSPQVYAEVSGVGCYRERKGSTRAGYLLFTCFCVDFLSLSLILMHCVQTGSLQGPLGRLFLKQGVVAFTATSVCNIMAAIVYFLPPNNFRGTTYAISIILTNILACRLILSLRRRVNPTETAQLRELSQIVHRAMDIAGLSDVDDHSSSDFPNRGQISLTTV